MSTLGVSTLKFTRYVLYPLQFILFWSFSEPYQLPYFDIILLAKIKTIFHNHCNVACIFGVDFSNLSAAVNDIFLQECGLSFTVCSGREVTLDLLSQPVATSDTNVLIQ